METYILLNNEYEIRTEQHRGVPHLVVPVVMMVEGVHSGSHGPLLHLAEELGRFPGSWDGIPVVVQHPEIDGVPVSANSPKVIDNEMVGKVYNTKMEDKKLKAEVWLDESRLEQVSPRAFAAIKNKEELDVSIGVFTDQEKKEGEYNGVTYEEIARNHRPDHLALLPGANGACGWKDGCGIRLNSENNKNGGKQMSEEKKVTACCLAKVEQLISNKATHFTKDDTEWLLAQEEATLDKLMPIEVKPVVNKKEVPVKPVTFEELLAKAPAEYQDNFKTGMAIYEKQKNDVMDSIITNSPEGTWTKEELTGMEMATLQKMDASIVKPVNYVAQAVKGASVSTNQEVLTPTGVEIKE